MTTPRIALVTGANKGIGFATARGLAERGLSVLLGARDAGRGRAAAEALQSEGLDVRLLLLDVCDADSIERARQQLDRLDVLVNNAAIASGSSTDFATVYATNVFGVWAVTRAMAPLLAASRGRVVNVSTSLGSLARLADPSLARFAVYAPAYASSKSALHALTVILAAELGPAGVRVDAVCPGHVATDLNGHTGTRTPEEGARIVIERATTEQEGTGGFFDEAGPIPW